MDAMGGDWLPVTHLLVEVSVRHLLARAARLRMVSGMIVLGQVPCLIKFLFRTWSTWSAVSSLTSSAGARSATFF